MTAGDEDQYYYETLDAAKAVTTGIDQEWNKYSHILRRKVEDQPGELEIALEEFVTTLAGLEPLLSTKNAGQLTLLKIKAAAAISEVINHVEIDYQDESVERRGWTEVHLSLKQDLNRLSIFLDDLPDARKEVCSSGDASMDEATEQSRDADGAA
ncbi:hypothetical protein AB0G05_13760 [Nonomuraea wenchangensis]